MKNMNYCSLWIKAKLFRKDKLKTLDMPAEYCMDKTELPIVAAN